MISFLVCFVVVGVFLFFFKLTLAFQRFTERFISTCYNDRDRWALHFDVSLDDLDLHSRS